MVKLLLTLGTFVAAFNAFAAGQSDTISPNSPPFALTLEQLSQWSPDSPLANEANVARVGLARRQPAFLEPGLPLHNQPDSQAKVLYAPDGMNNFANYLTRQPKFNVYNFTHWADIDVLNWFAGTAQYTIQIPARPWVEAAHKNGVKVIGSVFLGVARWGGNADTVEALLKQDEQGRFVMADKLIHIARYYGFDGWLMNQETDLTAVKDAENNLLKGEKDREQGLELAPRVKAFMQYLTANAPAGMEIHWYDAMIDTGEVKWQNTLNDANGSYLQDGAIRTSDAMFLNYWWNAAMVDGSVEKAKQLGRSAYDVYTGADLWPQRDAQAAFSEYQWYHWLFDGNRAKTSLAVFAPNFNYNFVGDDKRQPFSVFQQDGADAWRFYRTEQRLFSGDDYNLATEDSHGWPGLASKLAASTTHLSLPFTTTFNTGHGQFWFSEGEKVSGEWADISEQTPLPTWQFALYGTDEKDPFSVSYTFKDAYQGGSALHLAGDASGERLPLFATRFALSEGSTLSFVTKGKLSGLSIYLQDSKGKRWLFPLLDNSGWQTQSHSLSALNGAHVAQIGVVASTTGEAIDGLLGALTVAP
ncbi:endo-beta-N-acetylglucosaminidase [Aestuariibacter sp. A3R04]|uniref:endo-beta-N-acetylglucosaminidase n=1 Tax=Aestuariibacter sp. A3R04 TaxID=2841571 RepID=UPI001C08EC2C|nr:endo-beta-N-acetylglucosaminidase [Aestuariibacter sp. A3R04]MBU3020531.1 glycoside hydrolase [Aestuariibacter sp. A3R04]